jgi:hypothetical protein
MEDSSFIAHLICTFWASDADPIPPFQLTTHSFSPFACRDRCSQRAVNLVLYCPANMVAILSLALPPSPHIAVDFLQGWQM